MVATNRPQRGRNSAQGFQLNLGILLPCLLARLRFFFEGSSAAGRVKSSVITGHRVMQPIERPSKG